jgi:hypothetical protein
MVKLQFLSLVLLTACGGSVAAITLTKIQDAQNDCVMIHERSEVGSDRALALGCMTSLQSALKDLDASAE